MIVDPAELELDPASEAFLETDTTARRNLEVLREYAARPPSGKPKTLRLRFCVSPVAILGDDRVEAVEIVRNELVADACGRVKAVATDGREVLRCGLVLRSVGYRGTPIGDAPFDEGRARSRTAAAASSTLGRAVPGRLLRGLDQARPERRDRHQQEGRDRDGRAPARGRPRGTAQPETDDPGRVLELLAERGVEVVTLRRLAGDRRARMRPRRRAGPPRVKLCTWDDLLAAARGAVPTA